MLNLSLVPNKFGHPMRGFYGRLNLFGETMVTQINKQTFYPDSVGAVLRRKDPDECHTRIQR